MCHVLSEHMYVPCLIWTLVCVMSYLNTCMYHVLSEHMYAPCLIWTLVCAMSYLNTCMCHVLSEHMYVPCLIWTLVCAMSYLNTCMCHVLSEHLYVSCLIWTLAISFALTSTLKITVRSKHEWLNVYCRNLIWFTFVVFNATFNNISVISWRSVLLVEGTGVPGENHWPVASHWCWQFVSSTPPRWLSVFLFNSERNSSVPTKKTFCTKNICRWNTGKCWRKVFFHWNTLFVVKFYNIKPCICLFSTLFGFLKKFITQGFIYSCTCTCMVTENM
jgi:hypothetical protein